MSPTVTFFLHVVEAKTSLFVLLNSEGPLIRFSLQSDKLTLNDPQIEVILKQYYLIPENIIPDQGYKKKYHSLFKYVIHNILKRYIECQKVIFTDVDKYCPTLPIVKK